MGAKLSLVFGESSCEDLRHITKPLDSISVLDQVSPSPTERHFHRGYHQDSLYSLNTNSQPPECRLRESNESNKPPRAPSELLSASFEDRASSTTGRLIDVTRTPYCYSNPNLRASIWSEESSVCFEEEDEDNERRSSAPAPTPELPSSAPPPLPPRSFPPRQGGTEGQHPLSQHYRQRTHLSPPPPRPPATHKSDPRIYPICQNGVKMSDTHYWLIPAPPRRHGSVRLPRSLNESRFVNISDDLEESTNVTATTPTPVYSQLRRGSSERYTNSSRLKRQSEMAVKLQQLVPMATEEEVQVVLIGANWQFDEAMQRLKEELLCRTGYVSMLRSHKILAKHNWDLEAATRQAEEEYKLRHEK